jgi:hypothetical protein
MLIVAQHLMMTLSGLAERGLITYEVNRRTVEYRLTI